MSDWIDSKNILKWVTEDNENLRKWLTSRFSSYVEYFKSENATLNNFIRFEVKKYSDNKDTQYLEVQRIHKAWKSHERGLKNISNKVCKLQLEVSKSARDKLKTLSAADEISQSKYIEKLINYARKNPKLISKDTKVQVPYKHKQRTFSDSSKTEGVSTEFLEEKLTSIDEKISKLLEEWNS